MKLREWKKNDMGKLWKPESGSHKGDNGRVLVIGGSKLFHTSIFWSADVASRVCDLVHFTSPANENNEVIRKRIKEGFWSGIVVDWEDVELYVQEDDCILIGPGMTRSSEREIQNPKSEILNKSEIQNSNDQNDLVIAAKRDDTRSIVNTLLAQFPEKKWVVDGGALQEVDPELLNGNMIITPHVGEWDRLVRKIRNPKSEILNKSEILKSNIETIAEKLHEFSETHQGVTVLLKNVEGKDVVVGGGGSYVVSGGNEGLTKGGTGDVLAGLVAAFYAKNEAVLTASAASWVVKRAADELKEEVGVYFNAGDLVEQIPKVMGSLGSDV